MSKWLLSLRSGRSRQFVATDKSTGLGIQYSRAFLEDTPPVVEATISSNGEYVGDLAGAALYTTHIAQGAALELLQVSISSVQYDKDIIQSGAAEVGNLYSTSDVYSSFDAWVAGVLVSTSVQNRLLLPSRVVGFSRGNVDVVPGSEVISIIGVPYGDTGTVYAYTGDVCAPTVVAQTHVCTAGSPPLYPWIFSIPHSRVSREASVSFGLSWVYAGGGTTAKEVELHIAYELQTGATTSLQERRVNLAYEQRAYLRNDIPLGISYSQLTIQRVDTSLNILYAQGLSVIAIDFKWAAVGSNWMHTLLSLINSQRAVLGLAPYRLYDGGGPDISTAHARHMIDTHIYEHDSPSFPLGWRTLQERAAQFTHYTGGVSENQIVFAGNPISMGSPQEAYDAWYNSPIHYANMFEDWGPDADPVVLVGVDTWGTPPVILGGSPLAIPSDFIVTYGVLNIIDMALPSYEAIMQTTLDMQWVQAGALIEKYQLGWVQDAYAHVAARHTTEYAIRVAAQSTSPWAVRASATHTAPQHYTVATQHSSLYGELSPIRVQYICFYDIQENARVASSHVGWYSLHVQASIGSPYSDYLRVAGSLSADYRYQSYASTALTARYSDETRVAVGKLEEYALLTYDPVGSSLSSSYSLRGQSTTEMVDIAQQATVTYAGRGLRHGGLDISTSEDEFVWALRMELLDTSEYASISIDAPVSVNLAGEVFNFIVTGKSLNRDSPESVSMTVNGRSSNVRFTDPRAATISYTLTTPMMASALAATLLNSSIIWGIADWLIPPMYFAVDNVTPSSAVQSIVEAAGGIIESTPSGQLVARYRFPVSVVDFWNVVPDYLLTDTEDNLSYGESIDTTDIVNKLRIRNGSDSVSDSLEFIKDEGSENSGVIRAYVLPWREAELLHTGGATVTLSSLSVSSRVEKETVEIVDGEATLPYPAVSLVSVSWMSTPLGTIILDPRTSNIQATDTSINYGYGLVEVEYVVECYQCSVEFPVGYSAQFILKDK